MFTKISYYCKYSDGSSIWYRPDSIIKEEGLVSKTERIMLYPEDENWLQSKLDEYDWNKGVWLNSTQQSDWNEKTDEEYQKWKKEHDIEDE